MLLMEILKPSQYRGLVKNWDKSKYADLFKKYDHDKKAYRIFLPLVAASTKEKPSVVKPTVAASLAKMGYEIKDYPKGIATDGKRDIRIGKLLSKERELVTKFANDPARAASAEKPMEVIISRHPYDIGGMTTGRSWKSCMNLTDGVNKHYVPLDIKNGTIIAYLVNVDDKKDKNIERPIARMLIKPFVNEINPTEVLLGIENKVYGTAPDSFVATVTAWVNKVNKSTELEGIFKLHPALYHDDNEMNFSSRRPTITQFKDADIKAHVNAVIEDPQSIKKFNGKVPNALGIAAVGQDGNTIQYIDNPTEQIQLVAVKQKGTALQYIKNEIRTPAVELAAVIQDGFALEYVNNQTPKLQLAAVKREGDVIQLIKKQPSEIVQMAAVKQNGWAIRHIVKRFEYPSEAVQLAAVNHEGLAIQFLTQDPSEAVKLAAVTKNKRALKHIKNPSDQVRAAAK